MKKLGFEEIPQEPCMVQKNCIIYFFYADDIVFAFKKNKRDKVERIVVSLSKALTIERKRELKWFLGLHVIRDRSERALRLSQKAYLMNICNDIAAIATRPDIAFAVSQFLRFNQRLGKRHHKAADRMFHYLFQTQNYCLRYWGDAQDLSLFIFASDAFFGDNTLDRKSS